MMLLLLSFSMMEHPYSTLFLATHHGVNIYKAWRKTVPGVITWFCLLQQIAFKLSSVLSAALIVKQLSIQNTQLLTQPPLCWDTFMSYTMLAFSLEKVQYQSLPCRNQPGLFGWWKIYCRYQPCTVVWCLCSREVRVGNCLCMDSLSTNHPNEFLNSVIAFVNAEKIISF